MMLRACCDLLTKQSLQRRYQEGRRPIPAHSIDFSKPALWNKGKAVQSTPEADNMATDLRLAPWDFIPCFQKDQGESQWNLAFSKGGQQTPHKINKRISHYWKSVIMKGLSRGNSTVLLQYRWKYSWCGVHTCNLSSWKTKAGVLRPAWVT